ncbi:transcriptional regulator [Nonlabens tegetincola]|uniref:Transcriptional regulator n=1 Tax=Nonlabens tegetincola TaxID=323273 RepID=A0A090Q4R3_9FLAO|nr:MULTISPECIES: response regulator transcription factor [Nonlabens]MEE2802405.1 response regulator transcription factor [Bacteroidota bacterium]PQJ18663.1 DNA-binding response regulator [Nonlabens tegetincola]GAK97192.1 transcriptional regulator [Nonlabens tegetincola]
MIHIAIAEDHVSLSDGLKLFLEQDNDIKVMFTVPNGKEMLLKLERMRPEVILTDISMPEMNGVELCQRIKKEYPRTKVLALSMFENEGAVRDMIDAGVDGYMLKSSPLTELKKAIFTIADGKNYYDNELKFNIKDLKLFSSRKQLLSRSEKEILKLVAQGKTNQEIADFRGTAVSTIIKHRKNMMQKLDLHGKGELLQYAIQEHGHY